jgi:hypothetical protein
MYAEKMEVEFLGSLYFVYVVGDRKPIHIDKVAAR